MFGASSVPTHPVPVEAEAEAVQLLPHGPDVTEETAQNTSVKERMNNERS